MAHTEDPTFYKVRLNDGATARGDGVVCQLLGWAGAQESLGRVRIVQSTIPRYRRGQVGLVKRERLIPLRPRRAA